MFVTSLSEKLSLILGDSSPRFACVSAHCEGGAYYPFVLDGLFKEVIEQMGLLSNIIKTVWPFRTKEGLLTAPC